MTLPMQHCSFFLSFSGQVTNALADAGDFAVGEDKFSMLPSC